MSHQIAHIDRNQYPPDSSTTYGAAWKVLPSEPYYGPPHATVAYWIVYAPYAHPWWPYHRIALIHLRPTPGLQAGVMHKLGATHEIVVQALLPDSVPLPVFTHVHKPLHPINFVGQFVVQPSMPQQMDRMAIDRVQGSVDAILRGELNPDSDGRRGWAALYGDECL